MNTGIDLRSFGKDVLIYSFGNILLSLFGFIQVFIIPKYLSVEGYGYWQIFVLYSTYAGLLHLGFINGIHIRWAGKDLEEIAPEIRRGFKFVLIEQFVFVIPLMLATYFIFKPPMGWISLLILLYALIFNLTSFFMFTCMATRKFRFLTIVNVARGIIFLSLILILFSLGHIDYMYVITVFIIACICALFVFLFWFRKYLGIPFLSKPNNTTDQLFENKRINGNNDNMYESSLLTYGRKNIDIGIFVLLGTSIGFLSLSTDRMITGAFLPIDQFAIYAFASTISLTIYSLVTAISQVFFPYLSRAGHELRTRAYNLTGSAIILIWAALISAYFPLTWIVKLYLPQYTTSLLLIQIILSAVAFGSIIRIVHTNYFIMYRKQKVFFLWATLALIFSVILCLTAVRVWGSLQSVAIAVLIVSVIWYISNELSLKSTVAQESRKLYKNLATIISYLGAFWLASFLVDQFIMQLAIYIGLFVLVTVFFLRSETIDLFKMIGELRKSTRANQG